MKTVFRSEEIAHIWANESAPRGRSPGNLSFEGDAISSYATVIGRRIRHKGVTAYVLDRASFSISTSKSQGRVARAIPDSAPVFPIWSGQRGQYLDFTPGTLRDWHLAQAKEIGLELPSRYAHKRAEQFQRQTEALREAKRVCQTFGLGHARIDALLGKRAELSWDAANILAEQRHKMEAARRRREEKEKAERIARTTAQAEAFIAGNAEEREDMFHTYRPEAVALLAPGLREQFEREMAAFVAGRRDRWRAGAAIRLGYDDPVLLRVEGQDETAEMVTSKGARVPLADAKRTFVFLCAVRAKGWHRNGETHAIGGYQLDAVNEHGVVAGCHRVTWAEIEAFAERQGWVKGMSEKGGTS